MLRSCSIMVLTFSKKKITGDYLFHQKGQCKSLALMPSLRDVLAFPKSSPDREGE